MIDFQMLRAVILRDKDPHSSSRDQVRCSDLEAIKAHALNYIFQIGYVNTYLILTD